MIPMSLLERRPLPPPMDNPPSAACSPDRLPAAPEPYRPHFHFSPPSGWMNDPNGLYWHAGRYHLFYQHHPDDARWGPMHWGHASSADLIRWQQHPIALYPQGAAVMFSGSAVVDAANTSGLGDGRSAPVIAVFTRHDQAKAAAGGIDVETQGIACSLDHGLTFTHYHANPVLGNPGIRDFRDPKVTWDAPRQRWLMSLAAHDCIRFYASQNLTDWEYLSEFGATLGAHGGVWECPDLFPIQLEGSDEHQWVLLVSLNPGGPNGGSATQYFIGDFDGTSFTLDARFARQLARDGAAWLDWGRDNYAGTLFNHAPGTRPVMIGWMSNWDYAQAVPTAPWRGAATIARELLLERCGPRWLLKSRPIPALHARYHPHRHVVRQARLAAAVPLLRAGEIDLSRAVIHVALHRLGNASCTFTLTNRLGDTLAFGIDNARRVLFTDRRNAGCTGFSPHFADAVSTAPLPAGCTDVHVLVVLDRASIELFFNHGERVMSHIFFIDAPWCELSLSSSARAGTFSLSAHELLLD